MKQITEEDIRKAIGEQEDKPFIEHFVSEGKSMWRIGNLWAGDGGKEEFDRVMLEESKKHTITTNKKGLKLIDDAIREEMASRNITIQAPKPKHLRGSNYTKPKKRNKK